MNEPCWHHSDQHLQGPDYWRVLRCVHLREVAIVECGGTANHPLVPGEHTTFCITVPGDGRFLAVPPQFRDEAWRWMVDEMCAIVRAHETDLDAWWCRARLYKARLSELLDVERHAVLGATC